MKIISMIAFVVALGLVWTGAAIPQTTTTEKAKDKAERTADKVENKADKAADKAESKTEKAKDKAKGAAETVKDKAVETKDKMKAAVKGGSDRAASENTKATQEALKAKGFDPGPIDGVKGPRTTAAIRDFQKQQNLPATGELDMATRSQLGTDSPRSDSGSASPSTSPGAAAKTQKQSP